MKLSQILGTCGGVGYLKPAPGTWGSLVTLPATLAVHTIGGFPLVAATTIAATGVGFWAAADMTKGQEDLDPSEFVLDEFAGQMLALWALSLPAWLHGLNITALWPGWIAAFRPVSPVRHLETRPRGLGRSQKRPLWCDDGRCDRRRNGGGGRRTDGRIFTWSSWPMTVDVAALLDAAKAKGLTVSTAESCTGGMIAAALTDIAGSSAVVDRGFVTYSNQAKQDMLGVLPATLDAHGAVSEEVAVQMAEGALANSGTDIAVSVTGIAGPGGSEFKPEGRVCFGLAAKGLPTFVETKEFGALGRDKVRAATRDHALHLIATAIAKLPASDQT